MTKLMTVLAISLAAQFASAKTIRCPEFRFSQVDGLRIVGTTDGKYNLSVAYDDGTEKLAKIDDKVIAITDVDINGNGSQFVVRERGYDMTLIFSGDVEHISFEIADDSTDSYAGLSCRKNKVFF